MTKRIKTINVGLPRPHMPDPYFLATMNGSYRAEVSPEGSSTDMLSPVAMFENGASGLMCKSAVKYTLKGLDLTKPFTLAFDLNVQESSYVGAWTGIVILGLKDNIDAGAKKAFALLTTDDGRKSVNNATCDLFSEFYNLGWDNSEKEVTTFNQYHRYTFVYDGSNLLYYQDAELKSSQKVTLDFRPEYKGVPDLTLAINTGHNNNREQRFPVSNLYIAQKVVKPITNRKEGELVVPCASPIRATGNIEETKEVSATLPSQHLSKNGYTARVCNGYVADTKNEIFNLSSCPVFNIRKSTFNKWSQGDRIGISGMDNGLIQATPELKYMYNGQEVDVVGSWNRLNSNYADFTIGDNPNLTTQDIYVKFRTLYPKKNAPAFPYVYDDILMATNGKDVFYCNTVEEDTKVNGIPFTKLISDSNSNAIYFNRETGVIFRDEPVFEPLKIKATLVEFRDTKASGLTILADSPALVTSYSTSEYRGNSDVPLGSPISTAKDYHLIPMNKLFSNAGSLLEENNSKMIPYTNARVPFMGRVSNEYVGLTLASRLAKVSVSDNFAGSCVRLVLTKHLTSGEIGLRCYMYDVGTDLVPKNTEIKMFATDVFEK